MTNWKVLERAKHFASSLYRKKWKKKAFGCIKLFEIQSVNESNNNKKKTKSSFSFSYLINVTVIWWIRPCFFSEISSTAFECKCNTIPPHVKICQNRQQNGITALYIINTHPVATVCTIYAHHAHAVITIINW